MLRPSSRLCSFPGGIPWAVGLRSRRVSISASLTLRQQTSPCGGRCTTVGIVEDRRNVAIPAGRHFGAGPWAGRNADENPSPLTRKPAKRHVGGHGQQAGGGDRPQPGGPAEHGEHRGGEDQRGADVAPAHQRIGVHHLGEGSEKWNAPDRQVSAGGEGDVHQQMAVRRGDADDDPQRQSRGWMLGRQLR